MTRESSPIVEFITVRLNDAERDIKQIEAYGGCCDGCHCGCADPDRARRDIESKRRILAEMIPIIEELDEIAYGEGQGSVPYGEPVARLLKLLALPHADHDDYAAALATVTS